MSPTKRKASTKKKKGTRRKPTGKPASRKSTRRKPAKRKSAKRKSAGRWSRIWKLILMAGGLIIGLMVPWLIYLNFLVTSEFEGRKWELPSRVYARPLSLYPSQVISRQALELELKAAGYTSQSSASREGTYSRNGNRFEIFRRGFEFDDGLQEALKFRLDLENGVVSRLSSPVGSAQLGLVRLDPAEVASLYPMHDEDRTLVSLNDVPELLVTGLQAVEDRNFKHHHGVDPKGIARAMWVNLREGGAVQGGSTLTQQLVKNYYLNNDRSLVRKANEALMAGLLEFHYDKAEILEAYVNEVFLGQQGRHAIHGFGRGSEFFFGVPASQMQPHQTALLIGMVKGASYYNPRRNPERALGRRNIVLDMFGETGLLTPQQAESYKKKPLDVTPSAGFSGNRYPAFLELVRGQLQRDYDESDLRSEGLRIFTTLAPSEQEAAEDSLANGLKELADRGLPAELQGAVVLAEVDSGEVRALVGDRKASRKGFNRALNARRQVGSVIKPLVYLLALEHSSDYNWLSPIEDEPIKLKQPDGSIWSPANYDRKSHGTVSLLEAMIMSYNQATVRLGMTIGITHLARKLEQLGISRDIPPVPSTFLGAVELTPLEVAQVYQAIAAGGYGVPLRAVTAVQTSSGEILNRYPLRLVPLERRDALAVLNFGLTEVVRNGTARNLPNLLGSDVIIAGKTGTTNERRDSWFVGYTQDRVGVSWVGLDDNRPAGVTGSNAAMHVWGKLFRRLPLTPVSLDMPEGAYWVWVDPDGKALSDASCAGAVQVPYVAGSEPGSENTCRRRMNTEEKDSFWRKWFDKD